jgi:hypothetical protein
LQQARLGWPTDDVGQQYHALIFCFDVICEGSNGVGQNVKISVVFFDRSERYIVQKFLILSTLFARINYCWHDPTSHFHFTDVTVTLKHSLNILLLHGIVCMHIKFVGETRQLTLTVNRCRPPRRYLKRPSVLSCRTYPITCKSSIFHLRSISGPSSLSATHQQARLHA